jgi:ParB-like chromosome segregation protein Spo0J
MACCVELMDAEPPVSGRELPPPTRGLPTGVYLRRSSTACVRAPVPAEYVETREVPLAQLTPFEGNAKRGDVGVIRESIRRNGQYRSLVVRSTDDGQLVILAGNHTFQALQANKAKTARCEVVRCDDDTARRVNLVDNRAADKGSYDTDALVDLLSYLDGDYEGTAYTDEDVNKLIDPDLPEPGDADTDDDLQSAWGVIVSCRDELQQVELLQRLTADGLDVRALTA